MAHGPGEPMANSHGGPATNLSVAGPRSSRCRNFRRSGCPNHRCIAKCGRDRERSAMDRIPTTTGGALGGSRATAAGATAGVLPGRLGERRVSVAPESPCPLPGQGHGTGSGVASLERPGPRAGRGPSRVAPGSAADAPGTSFGAGAAGDARGRPRNLPEPSPKPSYRYKWNRFVLCCKERNLQWWPASPETVADYLEDCAAKYGSQALLRSIRRAIAYTHTKAGLADPCATRVVKATYDELIEAKGGVVSQSRNIHRAFARCCPTRLDSGGRVLSEAPWPGCGVGRNSQAARAGHACALLIGTRSGIAVR